MKKIRRMLTSCMIIGLLVVLFGIIFVCMGGAKHSEGYYELAEGWDVWVRDEYYDEVNLIELSFPLTNRGDMVVYEKTLPEHMVEGTVMQFYVTHATVEVQVDGQVVYEYGHQLYDENRLLGYGFHFVDIPYGSAGKDLKIILCVSEDEAFSNLGVPVLDDGAHIMRNFMLERREAAAVILFLVIFGVVFVLATVFFRFEGSDFYRLLCLAFFSLSIGIWNLCNYDIIMLFTYNIRVKAFVEFSAIYGAPMFLLGYFNEEALKGGKLQKYIYYALMVLQILFLVSASLLQCLRIVHFPQMLKYSHVIMGMMALYLIAVLARNGFKHKEKHTVLMFGMLIMVLFAAGDIIRFNLQLYRGGFEGGHFINYTYVGIFIFVLALIVDFIRRAGVNFYTIARNETLEKMAYTDTLTGLSNRRRLEEIYDEIEKKQSDYAIVALDLNDLKKMNDTLGHEAGDLYLREFSSVLTKTFADCGDVIRTGGDEFLVVIRKTAEIDVPAKIEEMNRLIAEVNGYHANWNMSTAYGICYGTEADIKTIREADRVADARMYEKKREMKGTVR